MTISYRLQMMGDTWVKCNSNLMFKLVPLHGHLFLVWLMRHLVPWLMALPLVLHTVRWAVKSHVQEENFTEAPNGSNILGTHKSQTSPRNKSLFCFFKKIHLPSLATRVVYPQWPFFTLALELPCGLVPAFPASSGCGGCEL